MQTITEDWVALEDEEDEEEGEGEEVMRALFVKEEDDETDAESDGDAVEEVFELFWLCRERQLLKLMCHEGQHLD